MTEFPDDVVEMINARLGGWNRVMGLRFVKATPEEFVAEVDIGDQHRQPYGLVHGGVYSSIVETVCSTGAALNVYAEGRSCVGLDNATSFLRAARSGTLRCRATPLVRGRRSHVWDARIHDDQDRLVATGRVRLLVLEPDAEAAGEKVSLKDAPEPEPEPAPAPAPAPVPEE